MSPTLSWWPRATKLGWGSKLGTGGNRRRGDNS